MRRTILSALVTLCLASPASAARDFRIAGQAFAQVDILDARSMATAGGEPAVLVTLTQKAWPRLVALSKLEWGKPLNATLDGKTLIGPVVREIMRDGMIELTGFANFPESEALAMRISGKPPVPDSLED